MEKSHEHQGTPREYVASVAICLTFLLLVIGFVRSTSDVWTWRSPQKVAAAHSQDLPPARAAQTEQVAFGRDARD